jgi:uncharacterized protein involved in exopolysaccharide biosynthesis
MTHASPDDIDIATLWQSLRRSLPALVIASGLIGGATFLALSQVAPRFTSEAQLSVVAKGANGPYGDGKVDGGSEAVTVRMDKEAVNTHVRALMSADLASRIATDMKLSERPEFNSALGPVDPMSRVLRLAGVGGPRSGESEQDRVLSAFYKSLEVYTPKESRIIGIRFSSIDSQLAADIANRIAETYRASLAKRTVTDSSEVEKALEPRIAKLSQEVGAAESDVERFRGSSDIFTGGPQKTGLNEQQLADLTAELSKAKAARSEAEVKAKSARELVQRGSGDILPDVQKSPLIQNLVQQRVRVERMVSELSATLLPGHPRMQQLNAELAGLKKQINSEVGKLADGLEKEAKQAAAREMSINKGLDEIKARVVSSGGDEVKLRQLEAAAKSKRSELERLQAQYEANRARADSHVVPVEAQIVTRARPSSVPSFPKSANIAALAAAATLLFGLAIVVTRGLIVGARSGGVAPRPMRGQGRPALGGGEPALASPALAAAGPAQPALAAESHAAASTSFRSLRDIAQHIAGAAPGHGGTRSIVTGEVDGIDPSAEAVTIARALAAGGAATILIEWSPAAPGLASSLGMPDNVGMNELLAGEVSFEDVVKRVPGSDVHLIGAGSPSAFEPERLDPDHINLILDALDEAYQHIVVAGRYEAARELFEAIQGRFDAGVTVVEPKRRNNVLQDPPGSFLGFEVADIALLRFERADAGVPAQRIVRAANGAAASAPA